MSTLPANRSSKAANSPISNKSLRMKASLRSCSGRSRDPCWPWMAMPSVLALRTFSLCSALFGWKWREDLMLLTPQSHKTYCLSKICLSVPWKLQTTLEEYYSNIQIWMTGWKDTFVFAQHLTGFLKRERKCALCFFSCRSRRWTLSGCLLNTAPSTVSHNSFSGPHRLAPGRVYGYFQRSRLITHAQNWFHHHSYCANFL